MHEQVAPHVRRGYYQIRLQDRIRGLSDQTTHGIIHTLTAGRPLENKLAAQEKEIAAAEGVSLTKAAKGRAHAAPGGMLIEQLRESSHKTTDVADFSFDFGEVRQVAFVIRPCAHHRGWEFQRHE